LKGGDKLRGFVFRALAGEKKPGASEEKIVILFKRSLDGKGKGRPKHSRGERTKRGKKCLEEEHCANGFQKSRNGGWEK